MCSRGAAPGADATLSSFGRSGRPGLAVERAIRSLADVRALASRTGRGSINAMTAKAKAIEGAEAGGRAPRKPRATAWAVGLNVVLPVIVGALIYLAWRSTDLWVFRWMETLGLDQYVRRLRTVAVPLRQYMPSFVLFSLPDGLWTYGLIASLRLVWRSENCRAAYSWVGLATALSVLPELGQAVGLVPGTFDLADLLAMTSAVLCAMAITGWMARFALSPVGEPIHAH
jgi:hypothetical protein